MRIVVSGIGVCSALGMGVESNFSALREGRGGLAPVTLFDIIHQVPVGEVPLSDAALKQMLGFAARDVVSRTSMLGMVAAREALDNASLPAGLRVGLVSSTSVGGMDLTERFYRDYMRDADCGRIRLVSQHDSASSTHMIADYCGITDFTTTISTACSSAANAIMLGARMIQAGLLDAVVAGGCDSLCRFTLDGFKSLMILDDAECRPFDATRAGLNLGEGAGYVVLAREDAVDRKLCFLAGYANANDAHHQTATSESGDGAAISMGQSLSMAGLTPADISYINVHGTGTGNNDASEGAAMVRVFGEQLPPFSSTKSYTGHTLAAAGGIEAVFSVLSLMHGAIFAAKGFADPMETLPLVPVTSYSEGNAIKAVMSNSFGFGGNCSTLVFSVDAYEKAEVKPAVMYVNAIATDKDVLTDVKELIPDANMRRRMSAIMRMGVRTGVECIRRSGIASPDAIITATSLGCLEDSEKFLANLIRTDEQLLNPTPFIQSTFNTIGGQIALIDGNHCYNMTYTHWSESLVGALLDALLLISSGKSRNVLVGAFEQNIPVMLKVLERLRMLEGNIPDEGACFMMLSSERSERTIAELDIDAVMSLAALCDVSDASSVSLARKLFERFV